MSDNAISYNEMCRREGASLQEDMNFGLGGSHSVILLSVCANGLYRDRVEDPGKVLVYEGHDMPKSPSCPNPKSADQPLQDASGAPTQNGRFYAAAQAAKRGHALPEMVRVYEQIRPGLWSYKGVFHLLDSWTERDDARAVCKFKLVAVEDTEDFVKPVLGGTGRQGLRATR